MNDLATLNRNVGKTWDRFYRDTIGYDPLFRMLDDPTGIFDSHKYPPYNILKNGDDEYRITLAVAGFRPEHIDVTVHDGMLTITGEIVDEIEDATTVLYKGIAARQFRRQFKLADSVQVKAADMENGLLHIDLLRLVPEEKKPKKIPIGATSPAIEAEDVEAAV